MENFKQKNPQTKFQKMIIFKSIQENFTVVGISPTLVTQSYPLNGEILMCFSLLGMGMTFIFVYTFNYAETIVEYMQSINLGADGFLMTFAMGILVFKSKKLFEFIDRCDAIVNMSK